MILALPTKQMEYVEVQFCLLQEQSSIFLILCDLSDEGGQIAFIRHMLRTYLLTTRSKGF